MGITQKDVDPDTWKKLVAAAGSMVAAQPSPVPGQKAKRKPVPLLAAAYRPPGTWLIPLHLAPVTNGGAVKRSLIGRAGKERRVVARSLSSHLNAVAFFALWVQAGRPIRCTITRLGGGRMDDDNLQITAKWVRDTIALFLGVDDGSPLVDWKYAQVPGPRYGVRVELDNLGGT